MTYHILLRLQLRKQKIVIYAHIDFGKTFARHHAQIVFLQMGADAHISGSYWNITSAGAENSFAIGYKIESATLLSEKIDRAAAFH